MYVERLFPCGGEAVGRFRHKINFRYNNVNNQLDATITIY